MCSVEQSHLISISLHLKHMVTLGRNLFGAGAGLEEMASEKGTEEFVRDVLLFKLMCQPLPGA